MNITRVFFVVYDCWTNAVPYSQNVGANWLSRSLRRLNLRKPIKASFAFKNYYTKPKDPMIRIWFDNYIY